MSKCNLCPKKCNVDRAQGTGVCSVGENPVVSRAALHFWEEPCISGENGSGAVFFSGCQLNCVYCQNKAISTAKSGREISVERLAQIFIELAEKGANNINLVTPDHFAVPIKKALLLAKDNGLSLPIVYNTSGYVNVTTLKMLDGLIDIYLPDFKYFDNTLAKKYSFAENYCETAKKAIREMFRQTGKPVYNENQMMQKGLIVRNLLLPGCAENSKRVLKYLYETYGDDIVISIMSQFTPIGLEKHPEINRLVTQKEYDSVVDYAVDIGIENAFTQEMTSAKESFIPNFFDYEGV